LVGRSDQEARRRVGVQREVTRDGDSSALVTGALLERQALLLKRVLLLLLALVVSPGVSLGLPLAVDRLYFNPLG
jgi:hypothetical protein